MKENERMKDVSNLEKHQEESWNRLKRDISSSTGRCRTVFWVNIIITTSRSLWRGGQVDT